MGDDVGGGVAVFSTLGTRATTDNEAVANRQSVAESSRGLHGGKKTSVCAIAARRERERERESDGGMRRGGDLGS